jgi:uroporphyrinogen-III synthase
MRGPLAGVRIAVTREEKDGGRLGATLAARGARVLLCPVVRTVRLADPPGAAAAARGWGRFDWTVFASARAVEELLAFCVRRGLDPGRAGRVAAVGPGTAAAVRSRLGLRVSVTPARHEAAALPAALGRLRGLRVLLPRGRGGRDVLPRALRRGGASVTVLALYRTVPDRAGLSRLGRLLARGAVDAVAFTSGSAVAAAAGALKAPLRRVPAASIGPVTSKALRAHGIRPAAEGAPSTFAGLARAIVRYHRGKAHART